MKTTPLILAAVFIGSLFSATGCSTLTGNRLTKNYSLVQTGMTEQQVRALLGLPEWRPGLGWPKPGVSNIVSWKVSAGPEFDADTVRVDVKFDSSRRVLTKRIHTSRRTDPSRRAKVPPVPSGDGLQWIKWDRDP